jgi:hypothetical protein
MVESPARRILPESQSGSGVSLGICIDQENGFFGQCYRSGEINCRGRLAYAALLIGHSDYARQMLSFGGRAFGAAI